MSYASCIAGLGNPGKKYQGTRHNLGFAVIDAFLRQCGRHGLETEQLAGGKFTCELWRCTSGNGRRHLVVKPLTFMNLSGESLAPLLRRHGIAPQCLLVAHDELDFAPGHIRMKFGGGHAGHKGVQSIAQLLGTPDFHRLRLGIGRPAGTDLTPWVLGRPAPEDRGPLDEALREACESILRFLDRDLP